MMCQNPIGFVFAGFMLRRLMTYLHIYQQDEYSPVRFVAWLFRSFAFDRKVSVALLLLCFAPAPWDMYGALVVFAAALFIEQDPCKLGKKPLILTARAKRILLLGWFIGVAAIALILCSQQLPVWIWIVFVQLIPFLLPIAVILLKPQEKWVQRRYWQQAHDRLLSINPTVIGVTGSYGKTSVKYLLSHVLQTYARTYATKGSINTVMGVSRAIREEMPGDCRFYIGEMGAYGIGSIARLCRLTPPKHGIITAIGAAHYERFKTLENVAKAKFELAEFVLQNKGKIVIAEQALAQPYAHQFVEKNRASFIICGTDAAADVQIIRGEQTTTGTKVEIKAQGQNYVLQAPIWGGHQAGNMALVFAMAINLGLPPEQIIIALKSAPQTQHRLEIKPQPDGSIYIDDAYNSNPTGFANALDTLSLFTKDGGRRILVTPGMAELGAEHDAQHAVLAAKAATCADIIIAVKPERIPTFVQPLQEKMGQNLLTMPDFAHAQQWLRANVKAHDVVLLENDLPDLYEKKLSL